MAYSIGLLPMIMVRILAPAFYAKKDVKTPMRIAIISLAGTQLFKFIIGLAIKTRWFGVGDWFRRYD